MVPQGTRPKIPESCTDGLASLLRAAWDPVPEDRPALAVILIKIQEILASKTKPFSFLQGQADIAYSLAWRKAGQAVVPIAPQRPLPTHTDAQEIVNTFSPSEVPRSSWGRFVWRGAYNAGFRSAS